ncbi:FAD-dependent oxidoreductase [Pseudoflavonifractor phocaeensis]|uniref:FAD-dependent oxidoreductase n=1 Tax=Pseudoflavonifractor phocaeensis TaxID=1870988 RepID=UPI00210E01CB|nr:FAD-dependent oxidoreductase [Pseudoflavonifractor phocaeensis]MCQ4865760.1 FAD-dependent oxidoreductase [Pseudoflavonifractor phocaeensis]
MKVLVIGGVAAGTKAAAKLKREDPSAEVLLLNKGANISYAGCGLPYYVGGVIHDKAELIVNTPEKFAKLTGVTVQCGVEATSLDRAAKTVTARSLQDGTETVHSYDKLVVAVGASPVVPPIEGVGLKNVFFLRTPEDAIALRETLETGDIRRAVVVGGGYIGLETAENLAARGIRTTVLEMLPQILPGFDPELAEYAENCLADRDIMVFTGEKVYALVGEEKVERVQCESRKMKTDLVVLSTGIRPNTAWLQDSGLEMFKGTLLTDLHGRTNDESIWALGDCAMVHNLITGESAWSPMGSTANIAARSAAKNMAGAECDYLGVLGTAVCHLPELNVGRTGLTEAQAAAAGFDAVSATCVVGDKAHYYPGSGEFIIKVIADRSTTRLLGVQVLGKGAVDKVVDVAVAAIAMKAALSDLANLDFAYAPPFSTAIHPFAAAVQILLNKLSGALVSVTPAEYKAGKAEGYRVVDVGMQPSIPGADWLDLTAIGGVVPGYAVDEKLLLVCAKGKRAYLTQNRLRHYGYTDTLVLEGGVTVNGSELVK